MTARSLFQDAFPTGFRRAALVVAPLGLVAVAAYLQAVGIGHVVAASFSPGALFVAAAPANGVVLAQAAERPEHVRALVDHTLFGAAPAASRAPDDVVAAVVSDNLYDAPACPGVTLATLATFADPRASLATLRLAATSTSVTVGQGEPVLDGRVLFVGPDRVWIDRSNAGGTICQAGLFAAAAAAAPLPVASAASPIAPDLAARVRRVSPDEVEIERGAVDEIIERSASLARAVRVSPAVGDGGEIRGYTVRAIAAGPDGALATALGLRSGDTLLAVNGFRLAKPDELLAAYGRLRLAPRIALDIERRGARQTLVVTPR